MRKALLLLFMIGSSSAAYATGIPSDIHSIYWSDADSGRLNGKVKFRLNSVDAPETGGVGAAIGGAECEAERVQGFESKEWIVNYTKGKELQITNYYGVDRYGRLIVDLNANDRDVSEEGLKTGHLKAWPHEGTTSLSSKPDWCR